MLDYDLDGSIADVKSVKGEGRSEGCLSILINRLR